MNTPTLIQTGFTSGRKTQGVPETNSGLMQARLIQAKVKRSVGFARLTLDALISVLSRSG